MYSVIVIPNEYNYEELIYPRSFNPLGVSWELWTSKWWKWLLSYPRSANPAFDSNGELFQMTLNHPIVWFLVGTIGGKAERHYKLDRGKPVLFPIINYIVSFADEPLLHTEKDLTEKARIDIDDIAKPFVSINNWNIRDIGQYRVQSPVFDLTLPEDNLVVEKACTTRAVSDGYWLFLRPPGPGNYVIRCGGSCSSGKTSVEISWHIEIV
jgi:hypothetical protein